MRFEDGTARKQWDKALVCKLPRNGTIEAKLIEKHIIRRA